MATYTHIQLYGIIIISLILIFSFIHLGVSIGIINSNRPYGDIFRPEIGLSSYNILISFLGIVVGVAGLIHMLTNQKALGKIVAIVSGILGIFTLVSLITALIINSKSASYVNTRFYNKMNQYTDNSDARDIIDHIQSNHTCCGETSWVDWAPFQSGTITMPPIISTSVPLVVETSTTSSVNTTTTSSVNTSTTSSANTTNTSSTGAASTLPMIITNTSSTGAASTLPMITTNTSSTGAASTLSMETTNTSSTGASSALSMETTNTSSMVTASTSSAGTTNTFPSNITTAPAIDTTTSLQTTSLDTASPIHSNVRRDINPVDLLSNFPILLNRQQRQAISMSNNMINIPFSAHISVPASCCVNPESNSNNSPQSTCSLPNQFYTNGCLKFLIKRANNQDMGIGIINCFMIVLAFAAIPFLLPGSLIDESRENLYTQQFENMRNFDSNQRNYPAILDTLR